MKHLNSSFRLLLILAALPVVASAQNAERRSSIGLNVSALQYQGDFVSDYWKFSSNRYAPGMAINLYLGRGIDLNSQLFYGEFTGRRSTNTHFTTSIFNANIGFKFKLNNGWALKEDAFIQPYLLAAPGWTFASRTGMINGERDEQDKGYVDLFGAAGLNFRLGTGASLFVQTGQHLPIDANFDGSREINTTSRWKDRFLQHTVGLTFNLGQANDVDEDGVPDQRDRCLNTPYDVEVDRHGCPLDSDLDGVPDFQDQCPEELGKPELQGCADRDNDGVADADDLCGDQPGSIAAKGCPDADNDGVTDAEDRCPATPAGAAVDESGCPTAPVPAPNPAPSTTDRDNDGVPDAEDRCPNSAGPASNRGCPTVQAETRKRLREATRLISFELGKTALLPTSFPTLDVLVAVLRDYPDYSLSIAGHTDSRGSATFNQRLSRDRAAAARDYLLGKGVAPGRIELRGYGAQRPIVSNATEAGRAQNRRVEFDLFVTGDPNAAEVKYGPEPRSTSPAPASSKATPAKRTPTKKAPRQQTQSRKPAAQKAPAKPGTSPQRPPARQTPPRQ